MPTGTNLIQCFRQSPSPDTPRVRKEWKAMMRKTQISTFQKHGCSLYHRGKLKARVTLPLCTCPTSPPLEKQCDTSVRSHSLLGLPATAPPPRCSFPNHQPQLCGPLSLPRGFSLANSATALQLPSLFIFHGLFPISTSLALYSHAQFRSLGGGLV